MFLYHWGIRHQFIQGSCLSRTFQKQLMSTSPVPPPHPSPAPPEPLTRYLRPVGGGLGVGGWEKDMFLLEIPTKHFTGCTTTSYTDK